tara:strand:- start:1138 stop:1353 length:216 start_codon:yes stop_codon:yes gene_type:complete
MLERVESAAAEVAEVAEVAAAEAGVGAEASSSRLGFASLSAVLSAPACISSALRTLPAASADAVAFCFHPK